MTRHPRTGPAATPASRLTIALAVVAAAAALSLPSAATAFAVGARSTAVTAVTAVTLAPIGHVDQVLTVPGGVRLIGWAIDFDSPATSLTTSTTVDGTGPHTTAATGERPDLARVFPRAGARHGFDYVVRVYEGQHVLCVSALDAATHVAHLLGPCLTRTLDYGPFGFLDSATSPPDEVRAVGWAADRDALHAVVTVSVTVDGVAHDVAANVSRPDVGRVYPMAGPLHGFDAAVPALPGAHTVCVTAHNIGYGTDNSFGCRVVTVGSGATGYLDVVAASQGQLHVAGWAVDPDHPLSPSTVRIAIDGVAHTLPADQPRADVAAAYPSIGALHGYSALFPATDGTHTVCVTFVNVGPGIDRALPCRTVVLALIPTASLAAATATSTGVTVSGWATDPDATSAALTVRLLVDGVQVTSTIANRSAASHTGHAFTAAVRVPSGTHTVCAVAMNAGYGTQDSPASCRSVTLALSPIGYLDSVTRIVGSTDISVVGWAIDPDTSAPLAVAVTVDGAARPDLVANVSRPDVENAFPGWGPDHGFNARLSATDGEHTVCLRARNVGAGADWTQRCRLVIAVHPLVPSAPRTVQATAGYGGAVVTWAAPVSDGGAPWSAYTVTTSPAGPTVTLGGTATTATVLGLRSSTTYTFTVRAVNVAGASPGSASAAVTTQASPPAQTTPAPVSTSRYIRNISGSSPAELATMHAEGVADATANPSGHGYLILLDIGGQDQYGNGVVLSAGVRFVSYYDLVRDVDAYVDGYHSAQRESAPVTIALGTNNDMDVDYTTGQVWASVVNQVAAHSAYYPGLTIAGANDIEPGFRASYASTRSWLSGYLAATARPFVFNGSADGCAWTVTNRSCNNGWTMDELYTLAAGAAPTRMLNLPQIYNTTMAAQWKYISLTGVGYSQPRIDFAGALTEWTACSQAGSCGSLTGHAAWSALWSALQSDARLRVASLPYSTDLRIDP